MAAKKRGEGWSKKKILAYQGEGLTLSLSYQSDPLTLSLAYQGEPLTLTGLIINRKDLTLTPSVSYPLTPLYGLKNPCVSQFYESSKGMTRKCCRNKTNTKCCVPRRVFNPKGC